MYKCNDVIILYWLYEYYVIIYHTSLQVLYLTFHFYVSFFQATLHTQEVWHLFFPLFILYFIIFPGFI